MVKTWREETMKKVINWVVHGNRFYLKKFDQIIVQSNLGIAFK